MRTTTKSGSATRRSASINILNPDGTLNENVPQKYRGLNVKKAREAVVADMEAAGLIAEIEDREIDLAHSDRSKTPIEPYLADQWFMKMDELAQTAMDAVTERPREDRARTLRQRLSRLAQRKTRLADWPATVVGASDSGVVARLSATDRIRDGTMPGHCRIDSKLT